ncbi:hypothetical protein SASPL_123488 [Salvia splendens]|uniref:LOB domain-containing protein n=1 Tax=Salvia splendens TaxID=180675 RepID=A0A8X8ZTG5_SALSN|nr:LOB domain-containing protein 33-like [Salvia splendens]KAG6416066.1 hypothetical protein SASPL_123488 [Salvia splendens]
MTGASSSCGACKFLRRRCTPDCTFTPYFSYEQAASHFSAVHRVFGASNVSKMLLRLPLHSRGDAAAMICYEALARVHDPVYGCIAHIFALQQQVAVLKEEIETIEMQMASARSLDPLAPTQISAHVSVNQTSCPNEMEQNAVQKLLQDIHQDYYLYQPE